jgi:hypothetical protein
MQRHVTLRGFLVTVLALASAVGAADVTFDLGKLADRTPLLRGFRAFKGGAPAMAADVVPGRKLLFERTYRKDGLMLRLYGMIFTNQTEQDRWIRSQQRSSSGAAFDVTDAAFRQKGIRLVAFGSKNHPPRTAQAVVNRIYIEGLAIRTDNSGGRPLSVALTDQDLAALRSVMSEMIGHAKRLPENKRP